MNTGIPNEMKIGQAIAVIGGIVAIAAVAAAWSGTIDSMKMVGLNLLAACMFFATAGTLSKFTPVVGKTVLIIAGLTVAVVAVGAFYEATLLWISVLMAALAIVCMLVGACPTVVKWVDTNRI